MENGSTHELKYTELALDNILDQNFYNNQNLIKIWYENRFKFCPKEILISYVVKDYHNRKCYLDFII